MKLSTQIQIKCVRKFENAAQEENKTNQQTDSLCRGLKTWALDKILSRKLIFKFENLEKDKKDFEM